MKLYTNTQKQSQNNQPQSEPPPSNTLNINTNTINQNLQPQPEGFSFKIQPSKQYQFAMAALSLYQLPSHISVVDQQHPKEQFNEVSRSATRSTTPRKKIFNQQNILFKLMEPVAEHIKAQTNIPPPQNNNSPYEPPPPKDLTSYIKTKEKPTTPPNNNQNTEKSIEQSFRRPNKGFQPETEYQRQHAYQILAQPILRQDRQARSKIQRKSSQPEAMVKSEIQAKIPEIMHRIDRNQKAILQLNSKVDQLVRMQHQKTTALRKDLSYKEKALQQKQHFLQSQIKHLQEQQQALKNQNNHRIRLEKQQSRRIQELIQENKLLCSKVMEQTAKNPNNHTHQDSEHLRARIANLQLQRQALEKEKHTRNLRNLDISIIPHQQEPLSLVKQQIVPSNQKPKIILPNSQLPGQIYQPSRVNQPSNVATDYRYQQMGIREVKVTKMY